MHDHRHHSSHLHVPTARPHSRCAAGAGLPVERVTEQHRTLLVSAGIRAEYGAHIPTLLRGVSSAAASRLLTAIRQIEVT